LRALIVTPSYPRFEGDYHGGFIQNLCRRLAEHVDLTVLAPRTRTLNQPKEKFKVLRFPYMPLKRMEFVAEITLKGAPPINIVELPPYLFSAYFHTLKEKQVDLVNTHLAIPLGFITSLNPIRVPKVVTCHGSDSICPSQNLL
jgi:hypothetical protein